MWAARRAPPRQQTQQSTHLPAPVGGVNSVAQGSAMPATDCTYAYNLIPGEFGLRARTGHQEWTTGLSGATTNEVRTLIPYLGSITSKNRLFAVTSLGIWDVTESLAIPEPWEVSTAYEVGDRVLGAVGSEVYECVTAGTSFEDVPGPTGTGAGIADNDVVWDYVTTVTVTEFLSSADRAGYGVFHAVVTAGGHFLFYADEVNGLYRYAESTDTWVAVTDITGVSELDIRFVTVFKHRLMLVEKESQRFWMLDAGQIAGAATQFDLASAGQARHGGHLVGLWNWTYDGGSGMDDSLVAITGGGDILIYQGTDPESASDFGLKGVWFCGGVVSGRRICTDSGGDLLIASVLGLLPLSKLVLGASVTDASIYATAKISNLFNLQALTYGSLDGWAMVQHPADNALLVLVPRASGSDTEQLAMSYATRGWFPYRDLPMLSACVWNGELYFGTTDGRVCVARGDVDGVELADPDTYTPVSYSLLSAFTDGGRRTRKWVHGVRPHILAQTPSPTVEATAKYDFDMTEPSPPSLVGTAGEGAWDGSTWDSSVWGGGAVPSQSLIGATGEGQFVAVAIRGTATGRTTLVGVDVFFEEGGEQ